MLICEVAEMRQLGFEYLLDGKEALPGVNIWCSSESHEFPKLSFGAMFMKSLLWPERSKCCRKLGTEVPIFEAKKRYHFLQIILAEKAYYNEGSIYLTFFCGLACFLTCKASL